MNDNEKEAARKILAILREHNVRIPGCDCCGAGVEDVVGGDRNSIERSTWYHYCREAFTDA